MCPRQQPAVSDGIKTHAASLLATGSAFIRSCLHQDAVNLNMSGVGLERISAKVDTGQKSTRFSVKKNRTSLQPDGLRLQKSALAVRRSANFDTLEH
jgi:hypothetical protein